MRQIDHHTSPYALSIASSLILLLVIAAAAWPNGDVKRVLFGVGLCVSVVLALACIFVGYSMLHTVEDAVLIMADKVDAMDEENTARDEAVAELAERLADHIALCAANTRPLDIDEALKQFTAARPRSA